MILTPKPDDLENGFFCVLGGEHVRMGVHPVMFGFRVCMWIEGDNGSFANWCGGADQEHVESLYAIAKAVLESREERLDDLGDIPGVSNRKPFFYDHDFVLKISELAGESVAPVRLPPLAEIRAAMVSRYPQYETRKFGQSRHPRKALGADAL